jgi:hypothetical protein
MPAPARCTDTLSTSCSTKPGRFLRSILTESQSSRENRPR